MTQIDMRGQSLEWAALFSSILRAASWLSLASALICSCPATCESQTIDENQAKADELAQSALDIISADLKQEIVNGSVCAPVGTTNIYTPTNSKFIVPSTNGVPATWGDGAKNSTLLRISSTTPIPFPGADHPASDALSSLSPANGLGISRARWNHHFLLPLQNFGETSDTTPDANFTVPSWVYVTGAGPTVLTTPTTGVTGRYAYAIYDEGALLDVNVAGYPYVTGTTVPPVTNGALAALYAGKGALAFADLTALGLSPSNVNNLVGWRNYATLTTGGGNIGTFPFFSLNTAAADRYYRAITSNTNGFLAISGNASNGTTDQIFLSRQAMIEFMTQDIADSPGSASIGTLRNALQYLGTFSRAVTAPSWCPQADASVLPSAAGDFYSTGIPSATGLNAGTNGTGNFAYKTNSETNGFANRNLANIRFPAGVAGTSIKHYDDTGNVTTYVVKEGDAYLQRRFSLARINWLTHTGPATGLAQAVKDCFGLEWGADAYGSPCWIYKHGSIPDQPVKSAAIGATKTPLNQILTLDAAAALGREPDFFELLKAAILSGSLGRDPGPDVTNFNNYFNAEGYGTWYNAGPYRGVGGTGFDKTSALTDTQIVQIGANIIDQYRSDSYPTAIFIQGPYVDCPTAPEYGPLNVVYGIKNLPYLNKIHYVFANSAGIAGNYDGFNAWIQPELWNPFQIPSASATGPRPTSFCLQASGAMQFNKFTGPAVVYAMAPTLLNFNVGPGLAESMIYFKDPLTAGVSTFANPLIVSANHQDTSVVTTPAINVGPAEGAFRSQSPYNVTYTQNTAANGYTPFLAIHAGWMPTRILPYLGQKLNGSGNVDYGIPGDSTHTWVADSNLTYYGSPKTFHNDGNFIVSVTPVGPYIDKNVPVGGQGLTLCLKYWDGSNWLPYSYMSRIVMGSGTSFYPSNSWTVPAGEPAPTDSVFGAIGSSKLIGTINAPPFMHVDPLTDRFSGCTFDGNHGHWNTKNTTWQATGLPRAGQLAANTNGAGQYNAPQPAGGGFYYDYWSYIGERSTNGVPAKSASYPLDWSDNGRGIGLFYGGWAQNVPIAGWANDAYYADPDGIVRPGNDSCWNVDNATSYTASMTDGLSQLLPGGYSTGTGANAQTMGRRPLVLNRPFRSVGELGYASRDLPFKTLDFFTAYSGDAALLDVFCVTDQPAVVAGQINPNNAPAPVLQAILAGATKQEALATSSTPHSIAAESRDIASAISSFTATAPGSFANRADLVTKLGVQFQKGAIAKSATTSVLLQGFSSSSNPRADQRDKTYLEAPIRALADVTNTRTWNLMIDVIAQTGTFATNAPATSEALSSSFNIQSETHYWLHVAIDRYTGEIVDQSLEQVPTGLTLDRSTVAEEQVAGATVGAINFGGSTLGANLTYSLVDGEGSEDNESFILSGNLLTTAAAFHYLTKDSYHIRVSVTDQNGSSLQQPLTILVRPGPYTQWKKISFQGDADNPAIAGDTANPSGDGLPNLLKYAIGLNPATPTTSGIAATVSGDVMTLRYTRASAATDTSVHAFWSSDLETWSATGVNETMVSEEPPLQLWQATLPVGPETPRLFMRLKITRP